MSPRRRFLHLLWDSLTFKKVCQWPLLSINWVPKEKGPYAVLILNTRELLLSLLKYVKNIGQSVSADERIFPNEGKNGGGNYELPEDSISNFSETAEEFPRSHNLTSNNRFNNERKLHLTHLLYTYYNHFKNDPRSVVLIIKQQNSETA